MKPVEFREEVQFVFIFFRDKKFRSHYQLFRVKKNADKRTKYRTNNIIKIIGGTGMPKSKKDNPIRANPINATTSNTLSRVTE